MRAFGPGAALVEFNGSLTTDQGAIPANSSVDLLTKLFPIFSYMIQHYAGQVGTYVSLFLGDYDGLGDDDSNLAATAYRELWKGLLTSQSLLNAQQN
jgi:hypothetical protein